MAIGSRDEERYSIGFGSDHCSIGSDNSDSCCCCSYCCNCSGSVVGVCGNSIKIAKLQISAE